MDIGKDLVAASATPLILAIVAEGDTYGYAILKRVADLSGGQLAWTDGMLYPVLHRLERNGHVESTWGASEIGRRRKYYRITEGGRAELAAQRKQWQAVDSALRNVWFVIWPQPTALAPALRKLLAAMWPPRGWIGAAAPALG